MRVSSAKKDKKKGRSSASTAGGSGGKSLGSGGKPKLKLVLGKKKMKLSNEQKEGMLKAVMNFGAHLRTHGKTSTLWTTTLDAWFKQDCMRNHHEHFVAVPNRSNFTNSTKYDKAVLTQQAFVRKCRTHYET